MSRYRTRASRDSVAAFDHDDPNRKLHRSSSEGTHRHTRLTNKADSIQKGRNSKAKLYDRYSRENSVLYKVNDFQPKLKERTYNVERKGYFEFPEDRRLPDFDDFQLEFPRHYDTLNSFPRRNTDTNMHRYTQDLNGNRKNQRRLSEGRPGKRERSYRTISTDDKSFSLSNPDEITSLHRKHRHQGTRQNSNEDDEWCGVC